MSEHTRTAVATRLTRRQRVGVGYGPARHVPWLAASQVRHAIAPEVSALKIDAAPVRDAAGVAIRAWDWRRLVGFDDRVALVTAPPRRADRMALFSGFVVDADWEFGTGEEAVFTARANAWRLLRDRGHLVYGQWRATRGAVAGASTALFSGLPCAFNAGGRPNCSTARQAVGANEAGPARGIPLFTDAGAADAEFWTFATALDYLQWRYNASQTYIANAEPTEDDYAAGVPLVVDCEGLSLWEALGELGARAGVDVFEAFSLGAREWHTVASRIAIVRRGAGTLRTVKHQAPAADGARPVLDLDETDLFSTSIAENVSSCVNAPVVVGGRKLYEITIPLQPAWDPARLEVPAGSQIVHKAKAPQMASEAYCRRYVVGGSSFHLYADVGRLWDANTDGRFSAAPYEAAVPDVALLCGQTIDSWPLMAFRPLDCLSQPSAAFNDGKAFGLYVEISFDSGTTWQHVTGVTPARDRLAVRLTAANLAEIVRADKATDWKSWCLFKRLVDAPSTVKMRLTCTVASPERAVSASVTRPGGSVFDMTGFFDRGDLSEERTVASSSRFSGLGLAADETASAAEADLTRAAGLIADANAGRYIEASVPIEWADAEISLGDRIERIEGIDVALGTNVGPAAQYPRVIAIERNLTPETYNTVLTLDTDRKAGVV